MLTGLGNLAVAAKRVTINFLLNEVDRALNGVVWLDSHIGVSLEESSRNKKLLAGVSGKSPFNPADTELLPDTALPGLPLSEIFEGLPALKNFPSLKPELIQGHLIGAFGNSNGITLTFHKDYPPDMRLARKLYAEGHTMPGLGIVFSGNQITLIFPVLNSTDA